MESKKTIYQIIPEAVVVMFPKPPHTLSGALRHPAQVTNTCSVLSNIPPVNTCQRPQSPVPEKKKKAPNDNPGFILSVRRYC